MRDIQMDGLRDDFRTNFRTIGKMVLSRKSALVAQGELGRSEKKKKF